MIGQGQLSDVVKNGFRLNEVPSLLTSTLRKAEISIVEAISREPDHCLSGSIAAEDSFAVNQMLSAFPACESWESGRHAATTNIEAGVTKGAFRSLAERLLVEAHECDLSVASEVTQARVREALQVGAETYEGELELDFLSRLSPTR